MNQVEKMRKMLKEMEKAIFPQAPRGIDNIYKELLNDYIESYFEITKGTSGSTTRGLIDDAVSDFRSRVMFSYKQDEGSADDMIEDFAYDHHQNSIEMMMKKNLDDKINTTATQIGKYFK